MLAPKLRFKREDGESYSEWNKEKWSSLGEFVGSGTLSKSDLSDTGTPCILYGELYTRYGEIAHTIYSKTNAEAHTFSKADDVILPKSGETPEDISTATCIPYDNVSLGGDLIVFRHNEKVIGSYLSYLISNRAKKSIASIAQGKSVVHINEKSLSKIELPYPEIEEQQKIANFLSNVDEVIMQSEAEVGNLEQQKKAAMQKIFSLEARFRREDGTEYPEWILRQISNFANCFAGGTPSTTIREYWEDGIISWLSSGEVNKKQIFETDKRISQLGYDKSSTKMVKPNSVVMALAGQGKTRGTVAITRIPVCTNQSLCAIETDSTVMGDYLYQYLGTRYDDLRNISSGDGIRGGLNLKLINGYSVPIPCLEEQRKIAAILFAYDEAIDYAKQELEKWKELKKGLLQQMFV